MSRAWINFVLGSLAGVFSYIFVTEGVRSVRPSTHNPVCVDQSFVPQPGDVVSCDHPAHRLTVLQWTNPSVHLCQCPRDDGGAP